MLGNVVATLPYLGTRASAAGDLMANEPRPYNATDQFKDDLIDAFDKETGDKFTIVPRKNVPEGSAFDRYSNAFQHGKGLGNQTPEPIQQVEESASLNQVLFEFLHFRTPGALSK